MVALSLHKRLTIISMMTIPNILVASIPPIIPPTTPPTVPPIISFTTPVSAPAIIPTMTLDINITSINAHQ
jgi:hypothetical protein